MLPAGVNDDRDVLAFQVQPEGGPADASTEELVDRLGPAAEQIGEDQGATLGLTGQTVANIDISEQLADALPVYLVVVVGPVAHPAPAGLPLDRRARCWRREGSC